MLPENELDIIAVQETKVESQARTDRKVQPFRALFNARRCNFGRLLFVYSPVFRRGRI